MNDALPALGAALVWAALALLRAGPTSSGFFLSLIGAYGAAALELAPAVWLVRRARTGRPLGDGVTWTVLGALLVSFPLALLGAVLFEKTHHRALGGVTYAFVALLFTLSGVLFVRRVSLVFASSRRFVHGVFAIAAALSAFGALFFASGALVVPSLRGGLVEFGLGMVLFAVGSLVPPPRRSPESPRLVRIGSALALAGAVVGVGLVALNGDLIRHLAATLPVVTFVARALLL